MMKTRYSGWKSFRFKGRQFLALILLDGNTAHVYDSSFNNYGCYFSVDNFKKFYERDGESLNLDIPAP